MNPSQRFFDVMIVGAGPVGLFLACELGLAGCSVLVLEQASDLSSPLKRPPFGLRGLSAATVDILDRRNLLGPLSARLDAGRIAAAAPWMTAENPPAGHFAGIDFFRDQIEFERWPYRQPNAATPMAADLESIEAVLAARALELGVTIHWSAAVSELAVGDDEVAVRVGDDTFRASWLVGCDGGRSTVRKAAGFGFTGTEPEFTGYFLEVVLRDPGMLESGHHTTETGTYIYEPPGIVRMSDFDGGAAHRIPLTTDHVQAVLRRVTGTSVQVVELGLATTWTDRAYLASDYMSGRVLLAGDAAHIHSPLGGQGLNLGLGDAMNLGWKLARVLHGTGASGLLETYTRERRPVAEQILDWSRAQVTLMRPNHSSRALRSIVSDLIATPDGASYFAERVWGASLRYDLEHPHPLVGRSVPDLTFGGGRRVNELLRKGQSLLLDFDPSDTLRALAEGWRKDLSYVNCEARALPGVNAVLVRPDGIVAWARTGAENAASLLQALARWAAPSPRTRDRPSGQNRN